MADITAFPIPTKQASKADFLTISSASGSLPDGAWATAVEADIATVGSTMAEITTGLTISQITVNYTMPYTPYLLCDTARGLSIEARRDSTLLYNATGVEEAYILVVQL